ncbi:uncharacterized protein LOC126828862 [Patella vulgata]|uniref:uncharacterized protein LOC126828862 n=1 Tax=Patella vulgata TaxID=6465 RepID=UPI00218054C5|nr:uncharacterized protein LOC126828862 [Patella vulgata]
MRGRPLDITDEYGVVEGKTVDIFVSRDRILEDAFSELKEAGDMSFPIEVTFTGEKALDLGGPRKEFLTSCVHNLNDQFIKDGILITEKDIGKDLFIKYEKENAFRTAGLLLGLSLLQGGPVPTLFKNPDVFLSPSNKGEELFSEGLDKIGLLQLCSKKKEILRLFDVNSPKVNILTYSSLIKLFEVNFSEEGSNGRQFEMAVYRLFLDYVKEVAGIQSLLQFVTGSPEVPILGYKLPPKICFCFVDTESIISTSSTCSVKLFLPKQTGNKTRDQVFDLFDYAFSNSYFGIV